MTNQSDEFDGEEEAPDRLKDKWFKEELSFSETVECPACKRAQPRENLTCIFCEAKIFEKSGLLGSIIFWFKKLFR